MLTFLENLSLAVPVFFEGNGEPFVPDAASLSWRLLDQTGTQLVAWTAFTTANSRTMIPVAANMNVVASGISERRTLMIRGKRDLMDFQMSIPYRLTVFTGRSCVAQDVRKFLGVGPGELPDADIDLDDALLSTADTTGSDELLAALQSDNAAGRAANEAIVAMCVIKLVPSLQQRFSRKETDGRSVMERFQLDFQMISQAATAVLQRGVLAVSGIQGTTRTLVQLTVRPDPLTGV
jgi:hypothetical protein